MRSRIHGRLTRRLSGFQGGLGGPKACHHQACEAHGTLCKLQAGSGHPAAGEGQAKADRGSWPRRQRMLVSLCSEMHDEAPHGVAWRAATATGSSSACVCGGLLLDPRVAASVETWRSEGGKEFVRSKGHADSRAHLRFPIASPRLASHRIEPRCYACWLADPKGERGTVSSLPAQARRVECRLSC